MIKFLMFRPAIRNIVSRLAAGRKSSAVPALFVAFMACNTFPADASIVTLRVRPVHPVYSSSSEKYETINTTLVHTDNRDELNFKRIFCTVLGDNTSGSAPGCEIFDQCVIAGNVWNQSKDFGDRRSHRIIIGPADYLNYIPGSLDFTLANSGITSHDGKWKINGIDLYVWNINAEEEPVNPNTGKAYPSALTVNGKEFTLEESSKMMVLNVPFEGEEQWMSNIILQAKAGNNVGVSRIVLHIDDVNGFNSIDPYADRLDYDEEENEYNIPSVLFGQQDFKDNTRLAVLDSEGNVLENVNAEYRVNNENASYFRISTATGIDPLTEGKYYACHYIDVDDNGEQRQIPSAQISDCIPFEILPVIDNMALNWGKLEKTGYNYYTCNVPPEIQQPTSNGGTITRGWTNAHISGHLPGTVVYWKILTQEEADSFTHAANRKSARSAASRVAASIPEGFRRLTGSGVDLSGGADLTEGNLGIVLSRNGVISDPKVVHYTRGENFPTNVSEIASEATPETVWYTLDGVRVIPGRCPSGTLVIRIDRYPDGKTVASKLRLYRK